jgi:hypothetical protein
MRALQVPNEIQASKNQEVSIPRERYSQKSELDTASFLVQASIQDNCGKVLGPDTIIWEY